MSFLRRLFQKNQPRTTSHQPQKDMSTYRTFSSFDAHRAVEEMGEMYFQCPKCGSYERVNDIGKMMLKSDPNYFARIECIKCRHPYNARSRIRQGRCPGFDYSEVDEVAKQDAERRQKHQAKIAKIQEVKRQLPRDEMAEIAREARAKSMKWFNSNDEVHVQEYIDVIILTRYLGGDSD